jgi:hypothetical protein
MKTTRLLGAFGALALVCANAQAATDSGSFRVSLRIAAPCDVSTGVAASGLAKVAVRCQAPSTPYRLEAGARGLAPGANDARLEESDGQARMTLTF